jgi:thiosulfate dehydrogenase [quinone] large subunit
MLHFSKYTYFFIKLPVAVSMFGHGLVRLPKLRGFSNWMVQKMAASFIPETLVYPFGYVLPIAELLIGLFLIIGLFTRQTLQAGILVMAILIFGSSSTESWDAITPQLIHGGYMAALLLFIKHDQFSIDAARSVNK